jgi:hypothetical protein
VQAQGAYEVLHEMNPRRWGIDSIGRVDFAIGLRPFLERGPCPGPGLGCPNVTMRD